MLSKKAKREIENITRQIVDKYNPEKVILFGSAVWGEFGDDSDLDFLIIKRDTPENGRDRARELRCLVEKVWAADFFVYRPEEIEKSRKLHDPFVEEIFEKGKILYAA